MYATDQKHTRATSAHTTPLLHRHTCTCAWSSDIWHSAVSAHTQLTLRARSQPTLTYSWIPCLRQRRSVCQEEPLPSFSSDPGVPLLKIWSTWFSMNSITTCWTRTARKAASPLQPVASISLDLNRKRNTFSEWVCPTDWSISGEPAGLLHRP